VSEAQGLLMTKALTAVMQMHADSARLLRDFDQWMDGYRSASGSQATNNLSYDVKTGLYMADGLFRHYVRDDALNIVLAINILFFDSKNKVEQPLLIAAKLLYASEVEYVSDRAWDPWSAYFIWNKDRSYRKTIALEGAFKKGNLSRIAVAAMPLYDVTTESVLHEFVRPVRDFEFATEEQTTPAL
jgi:hypothetical protein